MLWCNQVQSTIIKVHHADRNTEKYDKPSTSKGVRENDGHTICHPKLTLYHQSVYI